MGHVSSRAVKPEMLLLWQVILAYRGVEIVSKHVSSVAKVQFHAGAPIKMLSELSGLACPPPGSGPLPRQVLFRDNSPPRSRRARNPVWFRANNENLLFVDPARPADPFLAQSNFHTPVAQPRRLHFPFRLFFILLHHAPANGDKRRTAAP